MHYSRLSGGCDEMKSQPSLATLTGINTDPRKFSIVEEKAPTFQGKFRSPFELNLLQSEGMGERWGLEI